MTKLILGFPAAWLLRGSPAVAAPCGGDFETWLASFRREAAQQGISPRALAALDGVTPNPQVISLDRRQGVFNQSFEQFSGHRIAERLARAPRLILDLPRMSASPVAWFCVQGSCVL